MRARTSVLLFGIAMAAAACGGSKDTGGATGGSDTARDSDIATFTTAVKDPVGGGTISIRGVSCEGLRGPYLVTIAVKGNLSGETTATLPIHGGSTAGTLRWSMEVTGAETGTMSGRYKVLMSALTDPSTLVLRGQTIVGSASGARTFSVASRDVPMEVHKSVCPNP